ncbi:tRNA dihydrouridine synthase [Spirochaeta lutea]|uniref:tRNA dihydrouridine synthase n=1 Tax=Spirochaeta lutea TaxID=1480694 RepID=UPI000690A97F|nr:tRNA-dihydrouridine synthase [Spirochaeta lutea]
MPRYTDAESAMAPKTPSIDVPLGFWRDLPRPFTLLAPMEDVTDIVFRDIVCEAGRPHVFFTEFIGAGHLVAGEREALRRTEYHPRQHPIVAQIWGNNPEDYYKAAVELGQRGFDGLDINMGCPQPKITKKGACSALITNPALAAELIAAAQEGARAYTAGTDRELPVSVKTRIGFSRPATAEWCGFLLDQGLAALSVHGRIAAQMSEGEADWREIRRVSDLRTGRNLPTLIIGNGDLHNHHQLKTYSQRFGAEGLMVGRGIFENLYIFRDLAKPEFTTFGESSREEHLGWARNHLKAYRDAYEGRRNFEIMKKFFKVYLQDFPGAEELRGRIMETHSYSEASALLDD